MIILKEEDKIKLIKQYFLNGYSVVFCGKPDSNLFYNDLSFEHTIKEVEIKRSFVLKGNQTLFVSLFDLLFNFGFLSLSLS